MEQLVLRLPLSFVGSASTGLRDDPESYRLCNEAIALCDEVREHFISGDTVQAERLADHVAELVKRALALQSDYAPALVILSDIARNGWSNEYRAMQLTTQQRVDQAHDLLRRALLSDPTNAAAMSRIADIYRRFGWRWDDADMLFRHALFNDPADANAHWAYSHQLATLGRAHDAFDQALVLRTLDSKHLWRRVTLPRMAYLVGLRERALSDYYAELEALPGNPFLLWEIYYLHAAERRSDGLHRLLSFLDRRWRDTARPDPVTAIIKRSNAAVDAMQDRPAALIAILDAETAALNSGAMSDATLGGRARDDLSFILAIEYACARQYDVAIAMLDQALAAKSLYWPPSLPYGNAPFPEAMLADPRFKALWTKHPQLADAIRRRRRAAADGQMETVWPDGRVTRAR